MKEYIVFKGGQEMDEKFPCFEFLKIFKECREKLIHDTLDQDSPDLYDALYSDCKSKIYDVKMMLYELKWIELHWSKIENIVEKKEFSIREKKELISMFSKWYESFLSDWNYTKFDTVVLNERQKILYALITVNNDWEKNIKRMKVLFDKDIKVLNKKILEFKEE